MSMRTKHIRYKMEIPIHENKNINLTHKDGEAVVVVTVW